MATNAFGGLGLQNLGQENYSSGPGLDLGRALLAIGLSKSGLEEKMNNWGVGLNSNGQLIAIKPSTATNASPVAGVAPPSITSPQIAVPGEQRSGTSLEDATKTLMNGHDDLTSLAPFADELASDGLMAAFA